MNNFEGYTPFAFRKLRMCGLKSRFFMSLLLVFLFFGQVCGNVGSTVAETATTGKMKPQPSFGLDSDWLSSWSDPPMECRPLQIVHGIHPAQATPAAMKKLKELGLGGIVCNVNFDKYLISQTHWDTLVLAVEACREVGLIVWIYDEDGYPSGSAGGLVLKQNPAFEALALTL